MRKKIPVSSFMSDFPISFGIRNKILLIVLMTFLVFSIGLSVSIGVTSFQKFSKITMGELGRISAILSRHIENLEKESLGFVENINTNSVFKELVRQLSGKGPSYALDPELMDQVMDESERIYFFQTQLQLINILYPLFKLNSLTSLVIYLTSPFDMITLSEPYPVLVIRGDHIYANQFLEKGQVSKYVWYKIRKQDYTHPPPDYFDISSVYSLPLEKFLKDIGFSEVFPGEVEIPDFEAKGMGSKGVNSRLHNNIPVFKAWHGIESTMPNPETFEDETVLTGFIEMENELSRDRIEMLKQELGLKLGVADDEKILIPRIKSKTNSLDSSNRITIEGTDYYYARHPVRLNGLKNLFAVAFSPVSVLNKHTKSLSYQIALTGIVVMLVIGTIIFFMLEKLISRPLKKLMNGVMLLSEGSFESQVEVTSRDELGKLAQAFNEMSTSLRNKTYSLYMTVSELEKAKSTIASILNSMPSVIVGVDARGRVTLWNNKAEESMGISAENARGKRLVDVLPAMSSEMEKILESIRTLKVTQDLKRSRIWKNNTLYEDVTIYPLVKNGVDGAVIRIDDITDKVRMEEIMIQSEKMLSVGGLAAGMAHEINNPLAGMMQTAGVITKRLTDSDMPANLRAAREAGVSMDSVKTFMELRGIPQMVGNINESGQRVAEIVNNMLTFAHKSHSKPSAYDLADLIDKTLDLAATDYDLKRQYDFKKIEIKKLYEKGIPAIPCEGAKIQQVLLNILRNGAQAMQEAMTLNPCFTIRIRVNSAHGMVVTEIEDNGPGMDEATRKRVFEPFFTTKPEGMGTGLGLSVSYFIITENHGGELTLESTPGSGSKFLISLPLGGKNS